MKKLVHLILTLLVAYPIAGVLLSSCDEESDCSIAGRSMLRCTVKTLNENNNPVDAKLNYLTVTALGTDSILVNADQDVADIFLPLQYTADSTAIIFHYDPDYPLLTDTLIIYHTNTPYFISMDCGYDMNQTIKGDILFTTHVLDSLHITSVNTTNNGTKNIELFY